MCGFIAQLVEHRTGIAEVTGSNPVEALFFSGFFFPKALTSNSHSSAIADHVAQTGYRIKWDHFDILATQQSDIHSKIKETLLIRDLKPARNENVGSEKLLLY